MLVCHKNGFRVWSATPIPTGYPPGYSRDPRNELMIEHEVYNAQVVDDLNVGVLFTRMMVDPNHKGKRGRARHCIEVVGYDTETDRIYLLDVWAKASGYSEVVDMMYEVAHRWGQRECWMDTNGAEYLKFYMDQKNLMVDRPLTVNELPTDYGANAKEKRIEALEPIFKNGQFWCHRTHEPFIQEYKAYPASATVDCLDTLGYPPRIFEVMRRKELYQWMRNQRTAFQQRSVGPAGYSHVVGDSQRNAVGKIAAILRPNAPKNERRMSGFNKIDGVSDGI